MNKRKLWALITALGLAVAGLLLAFLLLGQITITADAAPAEVDHSPYRLPLLNADMGACSGVWVIETVDSAGDVGAETSLALAPTYPYTPHISYHDITSDSLKYAWLSGTTWLSKKLDSGGRRTSLALAPTYPHNPFISHHDFWGWALKYACFDGTSWITGAVDCCRAGLGGTSLALAPTYPYTPHISYDKPFGAYDLKHSYLSSTTWCSGTWWVRETVDSEGMVGAHNSLALAATYPHTPYISYLGANGGVKLAWLSSSVWLSETIDSAGSYQWTSLALDSSDNPHIGYFDFTNRDLKYAWFNGTTWLTETVDSEGDVGYGPSLALDSSDNPYISYSDASNGDLRLTHFDGTVWITQAVESPGWFGGISLALDQAGCPHISYYDATNGDLKYAYLPPLVYYLPVIFKNY